MLSINKICVDSRFKNNSSRSSSDFTIELLETITIGEGVGASITDISIPNTWYTIEQAVNDRLYVRFFQSVPTQFEDHMIILDAKNYDVNTLLTEILSKLNTYIGGFTGSMDIRKGTITLNISSGNFHLFTDKDLNSLTNWYGTSYEKFNLRSVNDLLKNEVYHNVTYTPTMPFVSGFVDVFTHHNIYITSSQLGSFQNIGPRGERNILKKVIVTTGYGEMITETNVYPDDYLDCSKHSLRVLDFQICDVNGNIINLHGAHISFSILFKIIK
jgi:hypothetical protein